MISIALQFLLMWVLLQAFLPELDFELNPGSGALEVQILGLLQNEGVHRAIYWAKYLTALFFFPFAALLFVLLYFDLAHRESGFQLEQLEQLSQRWFGPPSQASQTDPEPPEHPEGGEQ